MNNEIISTDQLSIGYDDKIILRNINLSLTESELVCFMGPNGSGKTTLLKTMSGFLPAVSGDVKFKNTPLQNIVPKKRAQLFAVVLTDRLQSEYMTSRELVASGRQPHTGWLGRLTPKDDEIIEKSLELTGTTSLANEWVYELSDGQRQKILIARALCQNTPIIILDEPTSHLDLNNRVAIVNLLRNLAHNENKTIFMATHELDLALQMSDRLLLANPGNTVYGGIPEDLVLSGTLDKVFKFKGFDLKTGQILIPKSGKTVILEGSGSAYLWTKNALERSGYEIAKNASTRIVTPENLDLLVWEFNSRQYTSISDLLTALKAVTT